jgi:hypothetical protein
VKRTTIILAIFFSVTSVIAQQRVSSLKNGAPETNLTGIDSVSSGEVVPAALSSEKLPLSSGTSSVSTLKTTTALPKSTAVETKPIHVSDKKADVKVSK